jgi:hypothetical protein
MANLESDFDDPKIVRKIKEADLGNLVTQSRLSTPKSTPFYPGIQIGYHLKPQPSLGATNYEQVFSLNSFPLSGFYRVGVGLEFGINPQKSEGHISVDLDFGIQKALPWHSYLDIFMEGGINRISFYQAEIISFFYGIGLRMGVGIAFKRLHLTAGLLLKTEQLDLAGRTLTLNYLTFELRIGL